MDVTWLFDSFLERYPLSIPSPHTSSYPTRCPSPSSRHTDPYLVSQYCDWTVQGTDDMTSMHRASHTALQHMRQPAYRPKPL
ncbi:hypothetical protein EON63_09600 [archaeon]|nr:MAG: hypothetical protein EON63_09600 [archaeon]